MVTAQSGVTGGGAEGLWGMAAVVVAIVMVSWGSGEVGVTSGGP